MDSCSIHKGDDIRNLIQSTGFSLLFTPPYSPQLNAIEEGFSKWKNIIKPENPNTDESLLTSIANGMNGISMNDCLGFFNHVREWAVKGIKRENF